MTTRSLQLIITVGQISKNPSLAGRGVFYFQNKVRTLNMKDDEIDYIKYLTQLTGAIMKSIEKHGLIPTVATLCVLCGFATMLVLAWKSPSIINSIAGLIEAMK